MVLLKFTKIRLFFKKVDLLMKIYEKMGNPTFMERKPRIFFRKSVNSVKPVDFFVKISKKN